MRRPRGMKWLLVPIVILLILGVFAWSVTVIPPALHPNPTPAPRVVHSPSLVPSFRGDPASRAIHFLHSVGLKVEVHRLCSPCRGQAVVVRQLPGPGVRLDEGDVVKLVLDVG